MDLSKAKKGKTYLTENVLLPKKTREYLEAFGLTNGTKISVLQNNKSAMIIKVRGTKLALGREYSKGIAVREMDC